MTACPNQLVLSGLYSPRSPDGRGSSSTPRTPFDLTLDCQSAYSGAVYTAASNNTNLLHGLSTPQRFSRCSPPRPSAVRFSGRTHIIIRLAFTCKRSRHRNGSVAVPACGAHRLCLHRCLRRSPRRTRRTRRTRRFAEDYSTGDSACGTEGRSNPVTRQERRHHGRRSRYPPMRPVGIEPTTY